MRVARSDQEIRAVGFVTTIACRLRRRVRDGPLLYHPTAPRVKATMMLVVINLTSVSFSDACLDVAPDRDGRYRNRGLQGKSAAAGAA